MKSIEELGLSKEDKKEKKEEVIELQERLKRECLLSDKISELKRSIKNASDEELDFLSINLDYLIDIMLQNEKIKKEYEYYKILRKKLGMNNNEHKN